MTRVELLPASGAISLAFACRETRGPRGLSQRQGGLEVTALQQIGRGEDLPRLAVGCDAARFSPPYSR